MSGKEEETKIVYDIDIMLKHGVKGYTSLTICTICEEEYKKNQIINHMRKHHNSKYEEWQKFIKETRIIVAKKLYDLMRIDTEVKLVKR